MLAGILLELCLTPVRGFVAHPWQVGPIVLVWLAFRRIAPKWAAPAAFATALVVIGIVAAGEGGVHGSALPHVAWTAAALHHRGIAQPGAPALHRHDGRPERAGDGGARHLRLPGPVERDDGHHGDAARSPAHLPAATPSTWPPSARRWLRPRPPTPTLRPAGPPPSRPAGSSWCSRCCRERSPR